ncbi:MAG: ACT domain-containing protein [Defluviitaleaceae bacterium]|nr:ACT domain-containing protein [Defluviitaleaceae bacterium]
MNAIIAVIGQDKKGILAQISTICAENNANITDVNQTVMQKYFAMILLADISAITCNFTDFSQKIQAAGKNMGMKVHVMHEDIFTSMHKI